MRKLIYAALCVLFALAVFLKARHIVHKQEAGIVSIAAEWAANGKPVAVAVIARGDLVRLTTVSGTLSNGAITAFVTPAIFEAIAPGQPFSLDSGGCGKQGYVAELGGSELSDTGLRRVRFALHKPLGQPKGANIVVFVESKRIRNILKVPAAALEFEGGRSFCWKVVDGKVFKAPVIAGETNGEDFHAVEGLKPGDLVVTSGAGDLVEGDRVRVHSTEGEACP